MDASKLNQDFLKLSHSISRNIKNLELSRDQDYLFSNSKKYKELNDKTSIRITKLIDKLASLSSKKPIDSVLDYKDIVKNVDSILDKISKDIEIVKGIRTENNVNNPIVINKLLNKKDVVKPELSLDLDIDNSYYPFVPRINFKYNKIDDLQKDLLDCQEFRMKNVEQFRNFNYFDYKINKDVNPFKHPYKTEVEEFYQQFVNTIDSINSFYNEMVNENPILDKLCRKLCFKGYITKDFYEEVIKSNQLDSDSETFLTKFINDKFVGISCDYNNFISEDSFFNYVYSKRKGQDYKAIESEKFNNLTPQKINLKGIFDLVCKKEYIIENNTFEFINDEKLLNKMLGEISIVDEIAIDLEAHSRESFQGLTCLIQISTRKKDYILDCIKLRSKMHLLNKTFTDCRILKILHGSDYDILWLQRDFGVYIVNSFDTGIAAAYLKYPSKSLAYLLKSICDVEANKKYQLADWRIRPLPEEMIKYAKEDTHYLFKIYDYLKNQLIIKSLSGEESESLLQSYCNVVKKSNELSLQIYEKPLVKGNQYYSVIEKCLLKSTQIKLLKVILKFRDFVARKLDYSSQAIFDNFTAKELAKLSYKDLTIENILILLKQKNCSNRFYPFIEELRNLLITKYKKIDSQIDSLSFNKEKIVSPLLNVPHPLKDQKIINNEKSSFNNDENSFLKLGLRSLKNKVLFQDLKNNQKLCSLGYEKSNLFCLFSDNQNDKREKNKINHEKKANLVGSLKLNNLTKEEENCIKQNENFESLYNCFEKFSIVNHLKKEFELELNIKKKKEYSTSRNLQKDSLNINSNTMLEKKRDTNIRDLTLYNKKNNNINSIDDYIELENSDAENDDNNDNNVKSRIIDPFEKISEMKSKNKSNKINNATALVNKFFKTNN